MKCRSFSAFFISVVLTVESTSGPPMLSTTLTESMTITNRSITDTIVLRPFEPFIWKGKLSSRKYNAFPSARLLSHAHPYSPFCSFFISHHVNSSGYCPRSVVDALGSHHESALLERHVSETEHIVPCRRVEIKAFNRLTVLHGVVERRVDPSACQVELERHIMRVVERKSPACRSRACYIQHAAHVVLHEVSYCYGNIAARAVGEYVNVKYPCVELAAHKLGE